MTLRRAVMGPSACPTPRRRPHAAGAAIAALWMAVWVQSSRGPAQRMWGEDVTWGLPRWRSAQNIPTQVGVLPVLFTIAWLSGRGSLETWATPPAARASCAARRYACEVAMVYIVSMVLLLDFPAELLGIIPPLPLTLVLHHLLSFFAHAVCIGLPAARAFRGYYWAGLVAFEMGSGACNVWVLNPENTHVCRAYLVVMTISNLIGTGTMVYWVRACRGIPLWLRAFGFAFVVVLSLLREKECVVNLASVSNG